MKERIGRRPSGATRMVVLDAGIFARDRSRAMALIVGEPSPQFNETPGPQVSKPPRRALNWHDAAAKLEG